MNVKELKRVLSLYEDDEEVKVSVIVDTNKLVEMDKVGEKDGIYFVDAEVLDLDNGGDDEPTIYAQDVNYDGYCDEGEE